MLLKMKYTRLMLALVKTISRDLFIYWILSSICCLAYFQDLEVMALPFGLTLIASIPFLFARLSLLFRMPRLVSFISYLVPWILWFSLLGLMLADQLNKQLTDGSDLILKSVLLTSFTAWVPASAYFWKSTLGLTKNKGIPTLDLSKKKIVPKQN